MFLYRIQYLFGRYSRFNHCLSLREMHYRTMQVFFEIIVSQVFLVSLDAVKVSLPSVSSPRSQTIYNDVSMRCHCTGSASVICHGNCDCVHTMLCILVILLRYEICDLIKSVRIRIRVQTHCMNNQRFPIIRFRRSDSATAIPWP